MENNHSDIAMMSRQFFWAASVQSLSQARSEHGFNTRPAGTARDVFAVSDVRLDYEGVTQQATVTLDPADVYEHFSFADDDGNAVAMRADAGSEVYFDGGWAHLEITPDGGDPVVISTEMASQRAAVLEIPVAEGTVLGDAVSGYGFKIAYQGGLGSGSTEGGFEDNETVDSFLDRFEALSVVKSAKLVGNVMRIETFDGTNSLSAKFTDAQINGQDLDGYFGAVPLNRAEATAQDLRDAINDAAGDGGVLDGIIGGATVDGTTITLQAAEAGVHGFTVSDIRMDYQGVTQIAKADYRDFETFDGGEVTLTVRATDVDGEPTGELISFAAANVDDLVAEIQAAVDGSLDGIVGSVTNTGGVVTLTSADAIRQQFEITTATASEKGQPQKVEVTFSGADADYFTAANDAEGSHGQVTLKINGQTFTQNMADTALETLNLLAAQISDQLDGDVVTFSRDGAVFKFEGMAKGDDLGVIATTSENGSLQTTTIAITDTLDGRDVSVTIADQTFTSNAVSKAAMLEDFQEQITTFITSDTGSALAEAIAAQDVAIVDGKLEITGKVSDRGFSVTNLTRFEIDTAGNNVAQEVEVRFSSQFMADLNTGYGLTFDLGGNEVTVVIADGDNVARMAAIAQALDASSRVLETAVDGNAVTMTAAGFGNGYLGEVTGDANATLTVLLKGESPAGTTVLIDQLRAGNVDVLDTSTETETVGTVDTTANVAPDFTVDLGDAVDIIQTAEEDTHPNVDFVNPGFDQDDSAGFFGDQGQTGAVVNDIFNGEGVRQSFVNTDDAYTATSGAALEGAVDTEGGNAGFLGDEPVLGGIDGEGVFDGEGIRQTFTNPGDGHVGQDGSVQSADGTGDDTYFGDPEQDANIDEEGILQTVTNPDSGYDAIAGSPQDNVAGQNGGNDDLFGSDPGVYTEDGLRTPFLNGGVASDPADTTEDGTLYSTDEDANDLTDLVGSTSNDDGAAAGSADVDANAIDNVKEGFDPFDWGDGNGEADVIVVTSDTSTADVINNFQVDSDVLTLEGSLLDSTSWGDVDKMSTRERDFDLSLNEFGLVRFADTTLSKAEIESADSVATLLNGLFDFSGTDNGALNTSIFAVTASDDDSVATIWAHQQSAANDGTVETGEMYKLATVNTLEGTFGSDNFEILHSSGPVT